jgi:gliding motility associated protien GldN
MKKLIQTIVLSCLSLSMIAQSVELKNQLYKKRLVKAIDLREKQNKPLYAFNQEMTKMLLQAVKEGNLTAYTSDSLSSTLTIEAFLEKIKIVGFENGDCIDCDSTEMVEDKAYYYEPRDLYQLELAQDWLFDKEKSVLNKENVSITLFVPADHPDNVRGFQVPIATFKFSDLQILWKDNPQAMWYNPFNESAHLNLSDAFRLELYSSYITKVSNPDDAFLSDIYEGKEAIIESGNASMKLMEYESNLWEY